MSKQQSKTPEAGAQAPVKSNLGGEPAKPLETRHVFLDTQVYRNLRHNPANRALTLLLEQIEAHRVVLHTTDITLMEVKRQIRESVIAHSRELGKLEKDLAQWRKASPDKGPSAPITMDVDVLAEEMFEQFRGVLLGDCKAVTHAALSIPAGDVFDRYFRREPPFHGEESKEFPDAFTLEVLSRWCETERERLYVVTRDGAMLKAADEHPLMLTMPTLHQVLASASADLDPDGDAAALAETTINGQDFDGSFEAAMQDQIRSMVFIYAGELAEGEAYQGELLSIEQIDGWTVVGLSGGRITLILSAAVRVKVEVQYEDREDAIYDREDDVWFGAESGSTEVEEEVRLEVLVDLDRARGAVLEARILTPEVTIYGPSEYDY
ncbi:MAG TPA: PIN domain-containing protein [Brevundimonas sp.]|jgi:hypothetical protein|uniref:PIN domain-containing protein n=1 Tax=Brevundimonas sp. TaxID=1871086 RepID=UPI002E0E635E|nr:PIN domain-containing protein [Brevundimonas sp.]